MRRAQINLILQQQRNEAGSAVSNLSRSANMQRTAAGHQAGAGLGGMYEQLARQQREIEQAQIASATTSHVAMLEQELIQQQILRDSQIAPAFATENSVAPVPASRRSNSSLGSISAMSGDPHVRILGNPSCQLSPAVAGGSSLLAKNLPWNAPGGSRGSSFESLASRAGMNPPPSFPAALDDTSFTSIGGGGSLGSASAEGKAASPAEARSLNTVTTRQHSSGGMSISETIAEDGTVESCQQESDTKSLPSDRSGDTTKVDLLLTAHAIQERKSTGAPPPTEVEATRRQQPDKTSGKGQQPNTGTPPKNRQPKSRPKSHPSPITDGTHKKKKKRTSVSSHNHEMKNGSSNRSPTGSRGDDMDVS